MPLHSALEVLTLKMPNSANSADVNVDTAWTSRSSSSKRAHSLIRVDASISGSCATHPCTILMSSAVEPEPARRNEKSTVRRRTEQKALLRNSTAVSTRTMSALAEMVVPCSILMVNKSPPLPVDLLSTSDLEALRTRNGSQQKHIGLVGSPGGRHADSLS